MQTRVGSVPLITNSYGTGNGPLMFSIYGNGDTRYYTYDETGRLINVKNDNTVAYSWTYSGSGIPNSYTDNVSGKKYQYTYDSLGRLIYQSGKNISDNNNQSSSVYKYDISNNLTQITNTAGTLGVERQGSVLSLMKKQLNRLFLTVNLLINQGGDSRLRLGIPFILSPKTKILHTLTMQSPIGSFG